MSIDVIEAIRARRSVKEFGPGSVSREVLESLLDLVVLAPNHRMTQPWQFVILGPEARRSYGEIKGERRARAVKQEEAAETVRRATAEAIEGLPALVGFVQELHDDPEVREEDFATVYMGIQNFLLGALAMGLGTHVKTGAILEAPETREALGIGEGERLLALVHVGAPSTIPHSKPRARPSERTRWLP
jgi:nitroreductase